MYTALIMHEERITNIAYNIESIFVSAFYLQ